MAKSVDNFLKYGNVDGFDVRYLVSAEYFKRVNQMAITSRPLAASPIHNWRDPAYRDFVYTAHASLTADKTLHKSGTGLSSANAVPGNFDAMLSVSGVYMSPRGFQQNESLLNRRQQELRLPTDFREHERETFDNFLSLYFEEYDDSVGIRIRDGSSSGPPYGASSRGEKTELARLAINQEDGIVRLLKARKYDELKRRYAVAPLIVCGKRAQQESPFKDRRITSPGAAACKSTYAPALNSALESRFASYPDVAGKTFKEDARFGAQRLRAVRGVPTTLNVLLAKYLRGYDDVATQRFWQTFKNRGGTHLLSKLNRYVGEYPSYKLAFMDVTAYDETFRPYMLQALSDFYSRLIHPDFGYLHHVILTLPQLVPGDATDERPWFICESMDLDERAHTSGALQSGAFVTSMYGRIGIVGNFLMTISRVIGRALGREDIIAYLSWDVRALAKAGLPVVVQANGGDDHVLVLVANYDAFLERYTGDGHFAIDVESESKYLGDVFYEDATGRLCVAPDITSFITKTFSPERDYRHRLRGGWAEGLKYKLTHYRSSPSYQAVFAHIDEAHQRAFGYSFSGWVAGLDAFAMDDATTQLLDDPDKIYYRIDENDVPEYVLDYLFISIDRAQLKHLWRRSGTIVNKEQYREQERCAI